MQHVVRITSFPAAVLFVVTGCMMTGCVDDRARLGEEGGSGSATTAQQSEQVAGPSQEHGESDAVDTGADTTEYREERLRMVREQIEARGVQHSAVLDVMRTVPRHRFVSEDQADRAYADRPLPIGHGQTISQPYIVAYMTELVQPEPSDRMLEVGTGSGYQAAVLAGLADSVYTVEIIPELAEQATGRLETLGYDNVRVRRADGYHGWREHAPFDGVIVTAAAEHIPPPLIDQLADGARMVIPVGSPFRTQMLMLVEKDGDDISSRSLTPVRFVPFTRAD